MAATRETVLTLRAIAVLAEKLASDLENRKLWEGDLESGVAQIQRYVQEVARVRGGY